MERLESRHVLIDRFPRGGIGAELGVERGDFSRSLADIARPRELWLIDAWRHLGGAFEADPVDHDDQHFAEIYAEVSRRFCGRPEVRIVRGLLHDVCRAFPAGYFDWIYLDACHARQSVAEDLRDWWPKLKPGGLFAGHDYWDTARFPWIDVRPAVDHFLAGIGHSEPDLVSVECCGSWAVVK